jgi:hypothetical protein
VEAKGRGRRRAAVWDHFFRERFVVHSTPSLFGEEILHKFELDFQTFLDQAFIFAVEKFSSFTDLELSTGAEKIIHIYVTQKPV